jgi:hypothetical protein
MTGAVGHIAEMTRFLPALLNSIAATLALASAAAAQPVDRVLVQSTHPYWEVGVLDKDLSTECARGKFNQVQSNRLKIVFKGPIGPAILGVATGSFNLYDPNRRAQRETSYFFFQDKTGGCQVYRFTKGDDQKKQGALPMDFSPYRSLIEDAYQGWNTDESVQNRPPVR